MTRGTVVISHHISIKSIKNFSRRLISCNVLQNSSVWQCFLLDYQIIKPRSWHRSQVSQVFLLPFYNQESQARGQGPKPSQPGKEPEAATLTAITASESFFLETWHDDAGFSQQRFPARDKLIVPDYASTQKGPRWAIKDSSQCCLKEPAQQDKSQFCSPQGVSPHFKMPIAAGAMSGAGRVQSPRRRSEEAAEDKRRDTCSITTAEARRGHHTRDQIQHYEAHQKYDRSRAT